MPGTPPNSSKAVGSSSEPCPLRKCSIVVQVVRGDTGEGLADADVSLKGPTQGKKKTGAGSATVTFDPVDPGSYQVEATLGDSQAKEFEPATAQRTSVTAGGTATVIISFYPHARLRVKVFQRRTKDGRIAEDLVADATVKASIGGAALEAKTGKDGIADFGRVKAGQHEIRVTLQPEHLKKYTAPYARNATVPRGEELLALVPLDPVELCWIEVEVLDELGRPVPEDMPYRIELADGQSREGKLQDGFLRLDGIPCGVCSFEFPGVDESDWVVPGHADVAPKKEAHWIEIALLDDQGLPVSNAAYSLKLADGTTKEGKLDKNGTARLDGIEPGTCEVRFPEYDENDLQLAKDRPPQR